MIIERKIVGRKVAAQSQHSASLKNFDLGPGNDLGAGSLIDPNVSPYSLDFERRVLACVRTPSSEALGSAAFLYQAQRDAAESVIEIPFETLMQTGRLPGLSPTLIFSPGRCGTTLLHRFFLDLGIPSISEPDFFVHLARHLQKLRRGAKPEGFMRAVQDGARVLGQATALLIANVAAGCPNPVIKLHQACNLAPLAIAGAFRKPRVIFVLRNHVEWAESMARVAPRVTPKQIAETLQSAVVALGSLKRHYPSTTHVCYYEDFRALDSAYMSGLLAFAGFEGAAPRPERLAALAQRDSQEGTRYSRSALTAQQVAASRRLEFEAAWAAVRDAELIDKLGLRGL